MSYYEEQLYHQAVQYIDAHIGDDLGVQQLAKQLCVSSSTLFRMFRRKTGLGPHRYIKRRKMEKALSLLKEGLGVGETAERLGYHSPGYFTVCFKQEMGCTPGQIK